MILGYIDIEPYTQMMVLRSSLESIESVEKLISQVKEQYALSDQCCNDVWVVLNEAVSNAIRHGNKYDPTKKVRLSVETKFDRYLCFTVKDEGNGFDPANIPDPTSPERIYEPSGRGVFLIKKLADAVNYTRNGSSVEMVFDLYKN